jgi:NAD(P)-dependent dehydrogenase (short-subunit alcohol dehydrogenase family)
VTTKTVFITGVSSGIGLATARLLDERGFAVFGTIRPGRDREEIARGMSDRFRPVVMELTDRSSISGAVDEVAEAVGERGLDALVNNAGTILATPLEQLDLDAFRRLLEVNVTAQIAVTQAFLPLLRAARGRIVNMGSVSGISALPTIGSYCATKFALEALTDTMRMELSPWGIRVSIIRPGSSSTNIMQTAADDAAGALDEQDPVRRQYAEMVRGMSAGFRRSASGGIPPEKVAEKVHRALTARRPKTRYLVGPVAYLRNYSRILPDSVRDRLTLRALKRI